MPAGNPAFLAADDPVIAVAHALGLDVDHVRADIGFADPEGAEYLSGQHARQIAFTQMRRRDVGEEAGNAASPTPPRPTTAAVDPMVSFAVLTTAPTPVSTAQPNSAASTKGMSRGTGTSERRETTARSAKAETPR